MNAYSLILYELIISIGDVTKEIKNAKFFHRIIDITEFVKGEDD